MPGQRIELPLYSMFASTPIYEVDGVLSFGLLRDAVVPHATDDLYTVGPFNYDRLDLIAAEHYGTAHLWWVIARVNNVIDPEKPFALRQQIRVPTKERLSSLGILNV